MTGGKKEWFEEWFDSPYYHLLYQHRDHREAEFFINNLVGTLGLVKGERVLDMACGRGRHAVFLNQLGLDVTGIDISAQSIAEAKKKENKTLSFFLHDMRKPLSVNYFDAVLNLFTSFGYFSGKGDNEKVLYHAYTALRPGGWFVLDFLNIAWVKSHLCAAEEKEAVGIRFKIKRYLRDGFICKEISFTDKGTPFHFTERVQALDKAELQKYFERAGLKVIHLWGDYGLNDFDESSSPRLILAGKK